jgi:uncharacterized ferritin-like protein (DUF455 family)
MPSTLSEAAHDVLNEPDPWRKISLTRHYTAAWQAGDITNIGCTQPPDHPARPSKPVLKDPTDMPRRRAKGRAGQMALVHAIAHIELNAIDLAWDIIARFTHEDLPTQYYDDWVEVAFDEAEHFNLLVNRMSDFGGVYGDLPAHNGLWEAAAKTEDDLLARLAIIPMTLEARGLDTTPGVVNRLRQAGDQQSADIFERIAREEVPHVKAGVHWFEKVCQSRNIDPVETYHDMIKTRFQGTLKAPFNEDARSQAGMNKEYYQRYDTA